MTQVACLLLVAGQSQRMEGSNKLFLDLAGQTVLSRVADQVSCAGFSKVIAVTGFEAEKVENALSGHGFDFAHNANFSSGMHSSIRTGLQALGESCDFFAVALGDQPFLRAEDYRLLIEAAAANADAVLIAPVMAGERGQPTLISIRLREEILAHADDDRGCHYLFARYPVVKVDLAMQASPLAFHDVDTPEAFETAKRFLIGADA